MRKAISPNDCKAMFSDKLNFLSMKELGIELKHFAIGTAPEYPSYLVNQDELKKILIEKFSNFFDTNRSQGLEVMFLRSNYGNGKSHFIRTIHSFLNNFMKQYFGSQEIIDLYFDTYQDSIQQRIDNREAKENQTESNKK